MTTDEALQVVDQVGALSPVNRQGHIAFQEAIATLRVALTKEAEKDADVQAEPPFRDGAKEEVPAE